MAGYPVAVHVSVVLKRPDVGFTLLITLVVLHLWLQPSGKGRVGQWVFAVCLIGTLAAIAAHWDSTHALFLPPVLISLLLLIVFARSLLPGREPLVTRIARYERGQLSSEFASYTRRVTWLWTGFMFFMALETLLLAAYASVEVWSLFANVLNYVFIGALFLVEYIYRVVRFRKDGRHTSPWRLITRIARQGISARV